MGSSAKTEDCALTRVEAAADGSVRVYGEPDLVGAMPGWFLPVVRDEDARSPLALPDSGLALEAAG